MSRSAICLIGSFVSVFLCGSLVNAANSVFYTFDELAIGSTLADGSSVADTSGSGNNATAHGGPTVVAGRLGGSALDLRGGQHLLAGLDLDGSWTLETQIKTDMDHPHGGYIIARDSHASAQMEFRVNQYTGGKLGFKWQAPNNPGGRLESWNGSPSVADDEWHHIAVSVDAGSDTMTVYVDGAEVHSVTNPGFTGDGGGNWKPAYIGNFSAPAAGGSLDGVMDFLRITDSVLGPADFFSGVPEPSSMVLLALGASLTIFVRRRK